MISIYFQINENINITISFSSYLAIGKKKQQAEAAFLDQSQMTHCAGIQANATHVHLPL